MKRGKKYIIPALALATVLGVGAYGVSRTSAFMGVNHDAMINRLAERFGLNKDEVQKVFDEQRDEMQTQRQAECEERLDQAVADGKLTDEQKKLILEKHEQMRNEMEQLRDSDLSRNEMREKMQQRHEEMEQWAKDNNIDLSYMMGMGRNGKGGFGKGGGMGMGQGRGMMGQQ